MEAVLEGLKGAVARVQRADGGGGTGFFIGHNVILTCAHVAGAQNSTVAVAWDGGQKRGTVSARFVLEGVPFGLPDLAVISLDVDPPRAHATVACATETPDRAGYIVGYEARYADEAPTEQPIHIAGVGGVAGGRPTLHLVGATLTEGMSGSPVYDPKARAVVGIANYSLNKKAPSGGLAIPISEVRRFIPLGDRNVPSFDAGGSEHTVYFTGRESAILRVASELAENRRAALSGIAGIGKTQTAMEYRDRYRSSYPGGVYWIRAENEAVLSADFAQLARAFDISPAALPSEQETLRAVLQWFARQPHWLLVFDNVTGNADVRRYLPQHGDGHILITSQDEAFHHIGITRPIVLDPLAREEAVDFLLRRTGRTGAGGPERESALRLAEQLELIPLALEQAGAFLAEHMTKFDVYERLLKTRRLEYLRTHRPQAGSYQDTIFATWSKNFEQVVAQSTASADVLRISSFLYADSIPVALFRGAARNLGPAVAASLADDEDELAMDVLLRSLTRYSLVRRNAGGDAFSIHRLVQEVVRQCMTPAERDAAFAGAVAAVNGAMRPVDYERWDEWNRLLPHAVRLSEEKSVPEAVISDFCRVLDSAGFFLAERSQYKDAKRLLCRAAELLGETQSVLSARVHFHLAYAYDHSAERPRAKEHYDKAIEIFRSVGFDEPPDDDRNDVVGWDVVMGLAMHYSELQMDKQAETEARRLLAFVEANWLDNARYHAAALTTLGTVLRRMGKLAEAEGLLSRALELRLANYAPDSLYIAASYNNLARLYSKQERYGPALDAATKALEMRRSFFPGGHDTVASALDTVAGIHARTKDYETAEHRFLEALEMRRLIYGDGNEYVATSYRKLAELAKTAGWAAKRAEYKEAARAHHRLANAAAAGE